MQQPDYFEFMCPTKTGSGASALEHLPGDLAAFNAKKPLIITDKRCEENGLIKQMVKAFKTSGMTLGVYDGIDHLANMDTVRDLCKLYQDKGFDSIIALGKGRGVSVAKLVNIAVSGKPEDINAFQGVEKIAKPLRPLVFIPVSSGGAIACSGELDFEGMYFSSKYLMPDLVTIDPRLVLDEDPESLVTTAMTALTYAAESYADPMGNPFAGGYAQLVIEFIMKHLLDVIKDSQSDKGFLKRLLERFSIREPRLSLMNASCMSGYVYENSNRGLSVRLGREIAKVCDVDPGLASSILLPYVLEYRSHRQGMDLSKIMRPMAGLGLYAATPEGQRFDSAMGKIRYIQNELFTLTAGAIPRTLEDIRLPKDSMAGIAEAVDSRFPDQDMKEACQSILDHAYHGTPVTP